MSSADSQKHNNRSFQPLPAAAVALALILAAILRIRGLSAYYLSSDDVLHLIIAYRPTLLAVWHESLVQFHPPTIYWLLHLMAKISRNDLYLRCVSLVPGLIAVPVIYGLGRRTLGRVGAAAMSFATAFAFAPLIMSQVVRDYGMFMLFETLALWALAAYFTTGSRRALTAYSASLALAVCFHYSAGLAGAGAGAVWLLRGLRQRSFRRELPRMAAAHAVPVVLMTVFLVAHIRHIYTEGYFHEVRQLYWPELFPSTLTDFIKSAAALGDYLAWPGAGLFIYILLIIGTVFLIKISRPEFAVLFWLLLIVNIVLAALNRYPFGGSRHECYLFPPAAILAGASVQWGWELLRPRLTTSRARAAALLVAALAVALAFWAVEFRRAGFRPEAREEFIVFRADYNKVMDAFREKVKPDDLVVLTNFQTYVYFNAIDPTMTGNLIDKHLRAATLTLPSGQYQTFVFTWWALTDPKPVLDLLDALQDSLPRVNHRRVWFIEIGRMASAEIIGQTLPPNLVIDKVNTPSAALIGYDQRVIYDLQPPPAGP